MSLSWPLPDSRPVRELVASVISGNFTEQEALFIVDFLPVDQNTLTHDSKDGQGAAEPWPAGSPTMVLHLQPVCSRRPRGWGAKTIGFSFTYCRVHPGSSPVRRNRPRLCMYYSTGGFSIWTNKV